MTQSIKSISQTNIKIIEIHKVKCREKNIYNFDSPNYKDYYDIFP